MILDLRPQRKMLHALRLTLYAFGVKRVVCSVLQFSVIFVLSSLFCFLGSVWAMGTRPPHPPRYIRVAVIRNASELSLTLRGSFQIKTLHTNEVLLKGRSLRSARVRPITSGIKINELTLKIYGINIKTERPGGIYLNKRRFRGDIDIIREADQTLLVVNDIDVEDYLYGVLRQEVSHRWPLEALKAQAVACRTFALYQHSVNVNRDYDLTCDIYSQLYGGKSSERFWTNRAVNRTMGEVLTYKGRLFPAYYHATCGGHTEDASKLWDINLPPLKGVKDPFCQKSPHFQWKSEVSLRDIQAKLLNQGYELGRILSISLKGRDRSGRVEIVEIRHSRGETEVETSKFRLDIGPNVIRSTNFTLRINGPNAIFRGIGWGHGVGLCQWGAYFMAKRGYNYEEVLGHYYPGAKITDLPSNQPIRSQR